MGCEHPVVWRAEVSDWPAMPSLSVIYHGDGGSKFLKNASTCLDYTVHFIKYSN